MGDPKDFMIILPISRRRRKTACSIFLSFFIFAATPNYDTKNSYKSYFGCSILRNDVIRCCNKKKQPQLDFFRMNGNKIMHTKRDHDLSGRNRTHRFNMEFTKNYQ